MVALFRTAPPSVGHCLGTTEPGGWSGDFPVADWDRRPERRLERRRPRRRLGPASFRAPGMATWSGDSTGERCDPAGHPQGVPLRSSGIGSFKEVPHRPVLRHDPARNRAGIVHQRRPPRCRCRTTRRGDPCGRPPPNGATVRRPLPGDYRTGGAERRLSSRRLGPASFRDGVVERRRPPEDADPAGHPQGVPLRSSQRSPPPAGLGMIPRDVHQRHSPERLGDPQRRHRPPAIAWALPDRGGGAATF